MTTFTEGQKVWIAYTDGLSRLQNRGREATVDRIARKWGYLTGGDRFDLETHMIDAGSFCNTDKVFESREAFDAAFEAQEEWRRLRDRVDRTNQAPVGAETIRQVRDLLKMTW